MGQLSSPGSGAVRYTSANPGENDPIFIFCNISSSVKGSLSATSPGGLAPFDFSWYIWDDNLKSFSPVAYLTQSGVTSTSDNLGEGGYKVRITDAEGYDTSLIGWIFIDKPLSVAALQNRTCDYVALKGKAAIDTFYYRNLITGNPVKVPNAVRFLWSSEPASSIPFPDLEINPQTFNPPLVDVTYKLQVSDSFGCVGESSFFYESIHVKADFSVTPVKGEAPLEVTVTDKSIRASKYLWNFGDGSPDSISVLQDPGPHIYYKPKDGYNITLSIESDLHCIDSVSSEKIVVDPSELHIPNVFTPDGDGINDRFMVESKSLRYISVEVFSRSGLKVYAFSGEGESLRTWTGWDGTINNTSVEASPGVYFYIIHAFGWDDIDYNGKEQRGFVYLYR
jgi:gliding motility-associated-like protein